VSGAATCPECGSRTSAFAAGCAACGADLVAHHRQTRIAAGAQERERRPRFELPRPSLSVAEAGWLALTLFFLAFAGVLGILLAILGAMHSFYEDHKVRLVLYCGLAGLGLAMELLATR
jgi:hypothetical protein